VAEGFLLFALAVILISGAVSSRNAAARRQQVDIQLNEAQQALLSASGTAFAGSAVGVPPVARAADPTAAVELNAKIARLTLEKYWNANLQQNGLIFVASIAASGLGFLVTVFGAWRALSGANISASILTAVAGGVTQIIGATFLVIYRSTADQALAFTVTLERINSVGSAWTIVESMSNDTEDARMARDTAKANLADGIVQRRRSESAVMRDPRRLS